MPEFMADSLVPILKRYTAELEKGILMTIDPGKVRIRILPIKA